KTTTVYVTHDQIEAMTMASKIVVMKDGLIEQTGAPLDLYDEPANVFVAGFIGSPSMNFLPGVVRNGFFAADCGLTLPLGDRPAPEGQRAIYGVRPEHFAVSDEGVGVKVVVVEPTGLETQIMTHCGKQEITCLFRDRLLPEPGSELRILPDVSRIHLFEEDSGKRIPKNT